MKQKAIIQICIAMLLVLVATSPALAATTTINSGSLQAAINAASAGDTLIISGTFTENVVVNKTITIQSTGTAPASIKPLNVALPAVWVKSPDVTINTVKATGGENIGIKITANNVHLQNVDVSKFQYGIHVESCSGSEIVSSNIHNNTKDGIYLKKASGYLLEGSKSVNNDANGISLVTSTNGQITGSTISKNKKGIELSSSSTGNTIQNNQLISNNYQAISLATCSGNIINNNQITGSGKEAILLTASTSNTISQQNVSSNKDNGIQLTRSTGNIISNNLITNNKGTGIYLEKSYNNQLAGNTMSNNKEYDFDVYIDKANPTTMVNNIDTTNTVDGNILYYLCNKEGQSNFANAGSIWCINCSKITIIDAKSLSNSKYGLCLINSNSMIIQTIAIDSCETGVYALSCNDFSIYASKITNSETYNCYFDKCTKPHIGKSISDSAEDGGIYISGSSEVSLQSNTVNSNNGPGIHVVSSTDVDLLQNKATNNDDGILIEKCSDAIIRANNASQNDKVGIHITGGSDNTISGSECYNNDKQGIAIESSPNAVVIRNEVVKNKDSGILISKSTDPQIFCNWIDNNKEEGLSIFKSNNAEMTSNYISNSDSSGVLITGSTGCVFFNNLNELNGAAISLEDSTGNSFFYNYFNNTVDVILDNSPSNAWDKYRYGNIWLNPTGTGFSQITPDTNQDSICDEPYVLDATNTDNYPVKSCECIGTARLSSSLKIPESPEAISNLMDTNTETY